MKIVITGGVASAAENPSLNSKRTVCSTADEFRGPSSPGSTRFLRLSNDDQKVYRYTLLFSCCRPVRHKNDILCVCIIPVFRNELKNALSG
jgi:hypothetical protein